MLRMTSKKPWNKVKDNLDKEMGYSHIWQRLAMLEDVLGDEYNIFELKGMIKREKEASGMKGHRRKGRLTKMIDVNGTQSVIGYVFGGNKVATAEKLGKVDICDLLFRLSEIEDIISDENGMYDLEKLEKKHDYQANKAKWQGRSEAEIENIQRKKEYARLAVEALRQMEG